MTWPDTSAGEISWEHLYLVWLWQLESTIEQIQSLGMILGAYVLLLSIYLWRFGVGYGDTNAWDVPQASLKHSRVAFPNTKLPELRSRGAVWTTRPRISWTAADFMAPLFSPKLSRAKLLSGWLGWLNLGLSMAFTLYHCPKRIHSYGKYFGYLI